MSLYKIGGPLDPKLAKSPLVLAIHAILFNLNYKLSHEKKKKKHWQQIQSG